MAKLDSTVYEGPLLSISPPSEGKIQQLFNQLNPSQRIILGSTAKEFLMGGGFGAGKTVAALIKGMIICKNRPGTTGFVARGTYPQLKDTVLKTWKEWCPPSWGRYVKTDGPGGTYYFNNSSEVLFRHFDKMSEDDIKSLNLGWAFVDQAEAVEETTYLVLLSRLRQQTVIKACVWLTANPRPGWLKRRFIEPFEAGEVNPEREVVNVETEENARNLPEDYIPTLMANYSEAWINRYIKASWKAFEGLVYPDFSRARHVIPRSEFRLDSEWPRTLVLDYGLRNPTHANAYSVDQYDNHVIIGEYRDKERSVPEYVAGINKELGPFMPFKMGMWADPSIKARTEKDRPTIQEEFAKAGLPLALANNDFDSGWTLITKWLKHDQLKVLGHCEHTIREFEEWEWEDWTHLEERNLKEQPKDKNNHSMDCNTYYANQHPEHTRRGQSKRPQSYKEIIEAEQPEEIDPEVSRAARDAEALAWFRGPRQQRGVRGYW